MWGTKTFQKFIRINQKKQSSKWITTWIFLAFTGATYPAFGETQIRQIIPDGFQYLAMESKEFAHEVTFLTMSQSEFRKSLDYQLYADPEKQQTPKDFIDIDQVLLFRANIFCFSQGFGAASSFSAQYTMKENFDLGELLVLQGWHHDGTTSVSRLPLAHWNAKKLKIKINKKDKHSHFAPHVVFTELFCTREATPCLTDENQSMSNDKESTNSINKIMMKMED